MIKLSLVAKHGNLEMARALAEQCSRAQLNARDDNLKTPLITAAAAGHDAIVKFLVEINVKCTYCIMCKRGYGCGLDARSKVR